MRHRLAGSAWMILVVLLAANFASGGTVTLLSSDAVGTTSFTGSTNWSNNAVPSSGNDYYTSTFGLRTPGDGNNYTFGGKSLTLQPGTVSGYSLIYKGTAGANTYTINNLTNNGGLIRSGAGSGNTCVIAGSMVVAGNSTIQADQSAFVINANLSGSGILTNLNPAPQTYGTVTYGGTNSAFHGELYLGANAIVIFANSNSAPGNPTTPNPGQITLNSGATLEDLAGVALKGANGGVTLAGSATIEVLATNLGMTIAGPVSGGSALAKTGSGALYLDAANSLTGTITVSAGTLAGSGSLAGPVTVSSSANLGAGDAGATVGTLTINNSLTLQGNVIVRVNKTGGVLTNDAVVAGNVTYGGLLTVTNVTSDGTALAAGDKFQLFNVAGTATGNFNTSIVGSPGTGLSYVFNPTNGVLSVVTTASLEAVLMHRYSFYSEPNGSLVATDLVAGANGTLAGAAAITGGKLVLNGASGTYASLPAGVINGDVAVTIEAWADFGSLPVNCYLFSFGNTDSSGDGADYIFCAPQAARITISGADPGDTSGAEQNAACGGWSGQTNLHVVAVYNPPAGYIAIYTNGLLPGVNQSITTPMTSVSNVLSYIGRSLYSSDPYAPLNVSEFRIWDGALTPQQIALDAASGPSLIVTNQGALQAIHLNLNTSMTAGFVYGFSPSGTAANVANLLAHGGTQQALVTGDFTNVTGVNLLGYGPPAFASGNTKVLTVSASGVVTAVSSGSTTISASYGGLSATQTVSAAFATNTFIFDSFGDGFWSIVNQGNGQALVVNSTGSTQAATNGSSQQLYEMLYNYQSNSFRIRQESSWLCVGCTTGTKAPGTAVTTVSYNGASSQQWNLVDAGGGYFRIANTATNLVLQTDNGSPANVTLAQSNASPYQLWRFVYGAHYPKKGIAGYEGDYSPFELDWAYNYDDHTSVSLPASVDFAPMIHDASWEPLSDVQSRSAGWRTQAGPDYLVTYNEPDNASQANMTTNQVIGLWPSLLALDVPLVSPSMQNTYDSWAYSFFAAANTNNYRVDYTAVHLYVAPNASSLISNLKTVYTTWGRPVWLTEFSPVDWNGNQGWTEDDDYNFLAEFMWQAEDQDWLRRYAIFPFSGTNALPPYQATTAGYRGNFFLADGVTLAPYGELFATWDADRVLHGGIPYIMHNLGTSFRLTATSGVSAPQSSTIYVRNTTTEWALLAAPTTNHWYIISLADGRRLSDTGGTMGLQPIGTTGSAVEWTFTGPDSSGYYFIGNPAGGHNLNSTGTAPAITFNTTSSSTQNNNTRWRLVKPYQPVGINTNHLVPVNPQATPASGSVTLGWSGGGAPYFNVYRGATSGGPYTKVGAAVSQSSFQDLTVANGVTYYYVVTAMNILGQESADSVELAVTPASTASTSITFSAAGGNNLQLSWPADHTGWRLQAQTNGLTTGLGTNWQTVAGSTRTNMLVVPADASQGTVFYRLVFP